MLEIDVYRNIDRQIRRYLAYMQNADVQLDRQIIRYKVRQVERQLDQNIAINKDSRKTHSLQIFRKLDKQMTR